MRRYFESVALVLLAAVAAVAVVAALYALGLIVVSNLSFILPFLGPVLVGIGLGIQLVLYHRVQHYRREANADHVSATYLLAEAQALTRKIHLIELVNKGVHSDYKISMITTDGDVLLLNEDKPPYYKDRKIWFDCSHKFEETKEIDILQIDLSDDKGVIVSSVPRGMTKNSWLAGTSMNVYLAMDIGLMDVVVK